MIAASISIFGLPQPAWALAARPADFSFVTLCITQQTNLTERHRTIFEGLREVTDGPFVAVEIHGVTQVLS
jgi:hypothetical protein